MPIILGLMGAGYLVHFFGTGGSLGLNSVNFLFMFIGIPLHWTTANYLRALNEAIKTTGGIVLQFPIYAGIMCMMVG